MKRKQPITVAMAVLLAPVACAEPIYYAVSEGQSYEKQTWRIGDLKEFNANRPENVFDLYTFHRLSDGTSKVVREFSAPSGDWLFLLTYIYARNGQLKKLDSEFRTFGGIAISRDGDIEGGLTRCFRAYSVNETGRLRKISERITDMKTGQTVARSFYEPEVKHWMTLRNLPIPPSN